MGREPDDGRRPKLRTRLAWRNVFLANVDARRAAEARQVDSVVDDEVRAGRYGRAYGIVAEREKSRRRKILGPELDNPRAAFKIRANQVPRPPAGGCSDVDVDDRVES